MEPQPYNHDNFPPGYSNIDFGIDSNVQPASPLKVKSFFDDTYFKEVAQWKEEQRLKRLNK